MRPPPPPRAPASAPRSRPCSRPGGPSPLHCLLSSPPCCRTRPKTLPDPAPLAGWQRPCGAPPGPRIGGRPRGSNSRHRGGPRAGASVARQGQQGYDGCVGECEKLRECGAPMGRPAPGPVISCSGFLCSRFSFLFFARLPVGVQASCRSLRAC